MHLLWAISMTFQMPPPGMVTASHSSNSSSRSRSSSCMQHLAHAASCTPKQAANQRVPSSGSMQRRIFLVPARLQQPWVAALLVTVSSHRLGRWRATLVRSACPRSLWRSTCIPRSATRKWRLMRALRLPMSVPSGLPCCGGHQIAPGCALCPHAGPLSPCACRLLRFFDMCPAYQQHEDAAERWLVRG